VEKQVKALQQVDLLFENCLIGIVGFVEESN